MRRARRRPAVDGAPTTGQRLLRQKAAVAVAACVVILTGCGSGNVSHATAKLPQRTETSPSAKVAVRSGPHAGQCHLVSPQALHARAFDTSKAVPCSHPHNVETASVRAVYGSPGLPDQATVRAYYGDCGPDVTNYLHLAQQLASRVTLLPVPAKNSHGRTIIECDLTVAGRAGDTGLDFPMTVTRTSLKRHAGSGDLSSWHLCGTRLAPSFPLTDCTEPQQVEAVFHRILLQLTDDRYPSGGADHNVRGDGVCRRTVSARPDAASLTVHSHWITKAAWESAQQPPRLEGTCWFWRSDGKNLPPVR